MFSSQPDNPIISSSSSKNQASQSSQNSPIKHQNISQNRNSKQEDTIKPLRILEDNDNETAIILYTKLSEYITYKSIKDGKGLKIKAFINTTNNNKNELKDKCKNIKPEWYVTEINNANIMNFKLTQIKKLLDIVDITNGYKVTFTSQEQLIRNEWKPGSTVEIYSESRQKWYLGKITRIYTDSEGEWLLVKYPGSTKEVGRYASKYIRPITHKNNTQKRPIQSPLKSVRMNVKTPKTHFIFPSRSAGNLQLNGSVDHGSDKNVVKVCHECKEEKWKIEGSVDNDDGNWYCGDCWNEFNDDEKDEEKELNAINEDNENVECEKVGKEKVENVKGVVDGVGGGLVETMRCMECDKDKAVIGGDYDDDDGNWYCEDCWREFEDDKNENEK